MRFHIVACVCVSFAFAAVPVRGQETVDLTPRFQAGQRWSGSVENAIRVQTTDGPAGPINTAGLLQSTLEYSATVIEAQAGRWTTLDVAFESCELKMQQPGAQRAQSTKDPLDNKRIQMTRTIDAETRNEEIDIEPHGMPALPV